MTHKRTNADKSSAESSASAGISRRPILKAAGTGILGVGLAGCSGGGSSGDGNGAKTTNQSNGGSKFSGVTFKFWDRTYFPDSRLADKTVESWVSQFEKETGATVKVNKVTDNQPIVEAFKSGNQPHVITPETANTGNWILADFLQPFSEYQDKFPDTVSNLHPGAKNVLEFSYLGYDGSYMLPLTIAPYAPFIGRMDHFKEAGLDPKKDFPPKDYDDLVRIANKLKQDGPADTGYQIYGDPADSTDVYFNQWTAAEGGEKGFVFGNDWSTVNFDNEVWKKVWAQNVELHTKHGHGSPGTPTLTDEPAVNQLIGGSISLCQQVPQNNPVFVERASNLFQEGKLKWGVNWGGNTGIKGKGSLSGATFTTKPDGKDKATWDKQQAAAYEFVKSLQSTELLTDNFATMGFTPAREDQLQNVKENDTNTAGGWLDVVRNCYSDNMLHYQAHPVWSEALYDIFGKHGQASIQGKKSPQKACGDAAAEAQKLVDESEFGK